VVFFPAYELNRFVLFPDSIHRYPIFFESLESVVVFFPVSELNRFVFFSIQFTIFEYFFTSNMYFRFFFFSQNLYVLRIRWSFFLPQVKPQLSYGL
jgi:hypothetical protein